MTDQSFTAARKPLSRRTMLKTAAWSAPVIAVAIAAPAAAASGGRASMKINTNPCNYFYGLPGIRTGVITQFSVSNQYVDWQNPPLISTIRITVDYPAAWITTDAPFNVTGLTGPTGAWTVGTPVLMSNGTIARYIFDFVASPTPLDSDPSQTTPVVSFTAQGISPDIQGSIGLLNVTITASSPDAIINDTYTTLVGN